MAKVLARSARPQVDRCRRLSGSCHPSAASRLGSIPLLLPHGDPQLTGLRGWVGRWPLTGLLVIALGLSWLLFVIPVLAFRGIIPGANLPVEVFALGFKRHTPLPDSSAEVV